MARFISYLLLAATAAKYAAVAALGPASIEFDAQGYWDLSTRVAAGDLLLMGEPIAYRTPLYPWFLAAVRVLAGDHALPGVVVLQSAMLIASFWMAGLIAVRVTGRPSAMAWTLLVALPAVSGTVYVATLLTEALFTFLLMGNLLSLIAYLQSLGGGDERGREINRARRRFAIEPTTGFLVLFSVSFAMALLTRPIALHLWLPHLGLAAWLVIRGQRTGGRFAVHALVAAGIVLLLLTPWLVRNQRLFGSPFLTEFVGRNIWIVTFQDGSGAGLDLPETSSASRLLQRLGDVRNQQRWRATWDVSQALVDSGLSDPEADRLMKQVAIDAIRRNPVPWTYKTIRRLANYWRCAVTDLPALGRADGNYVGQQTWSYAVPWVSSAIEHRFSRSVGFNTVVATSIGIAVIILTVSAGTRPAALWMGMILAYFTIVTGVLEIPNYRYRMIVEPLSAAAVGSAIAMVLSHLTHSGSAIDDAA